MFGRKRNEPQNIRKSGVTRKIKIGNKEVTIRLNNAFVGTRDGRDELMDEVLVRNMLNQIGASIKANSSSYNPIPDKITFDLGTTQTAEGTGKQETSDASDEQGEIIESYEPRFQLEQVALNEETKRQIEIAISSVRHKKELVEDWGLSEHFSGNRATILNFYGKPGTGKSMTAEAIASALGKKVYRINYSDLESKYVGETPKNMNSEREAIKQLILTAGQEKPRVIVAIDGRCAAGKTTLANHLKQELDAAVFHMDDFFLRPEQRTADRLNTPGGNVDYERFAAEILHPVRNGAAHVELRVYDCASQTIQKPVRVPVGRIVLVEGSYSCHPALWDCYDLRIFLTVSPDAQRKRILERNGEEKLAVFLNRWIPMEERYFAAFDIQETCDFFGRGGK